MIPKIIHYCWFGKGLMPHSQKKCIEGWKKLMPDYTIMRWDESTFDLDKYPLAKYACEVKKYALASDVCRYNVLAEYGGIYLDTDVEVFKRFDEFLGYNFFTGIELYNEFYAEHIQERYLNADGTAKDPTQDVPRLEILTSSMACCPNLKMICDIRDYYNSAEATPERALHYRDWVNNDRLVARHLTQYGFRYKDETQHLANNMIVFGTGIFGYAFSPKTTYEYSFHHNAATWESEKWNRSQKMAMFFDKLGLLPIYKKYKNIKKKIKHHVLTPVQGEIWCLHRVVNERSQYPSNRELEITPSYLEQLINEYKRQGFQFVSIETIVSSIRGKRKYGQAKRCAITFDDGFKDIYENAWPILKREGLPFTIYLTTGMPDGKACLWWEQMARLALSVDEFETAVKEIYVSSDNMTEVFLNRFKVKPDLELTRNLSLSWEQIQEMVDSGLCSIGSHTVSHSGMNRLPVDQMRKELIESKQRIESQLRINVLHFSYPHSMANSEVVSLVKECGYQSATLGYGGKVRWKDNPYLLNRHYIVEKN